MHKDKKLHVCCGDVYLKGYTNIDIVGTVIDDPDGWAEYGTTLDNYYIKPLDLDSVRYKKEEQFIDKTVDILKPWPFFNNSIAEIVMIQSIEHFTVPEAQFIISEIYRVLEINGKFIFDFPDIVETFNLFNCNKIKWSEMVRMIYGTWADEYARHKYAYLSSTFYNMLSLDRNWRSVEFKEVVKHDYPTIGGIAIK